MNQADELRYLILAVQREGNRLFAEQLRPLSLTPSQAEVMGVLYEEEQPLSLIELGERLVCEAGSPSRLVDGLVKAGMVERIPSPIDQRKVALSLTIQGKELYVQVAGIEQQFNALLTGLGSQADIETIMTAFWQFVQDKPAGCALARRLHRKQT